MIPAVRGVIYSDLDGTLVDSKTFEPGAGVVRLVDELARNGILVIPVTSKTVPEVMRLWDTLALAPLAIVEGGAVLVIKGQSPVVLGPSRTALVRVLHQLRDEGWPITGVSQMTADELSQVSGLDHAGAIRAMNRLGSEPFIIDGNAGVKAPQLRRRIEQLGASTVRGDRFWHLLGKGIGKGAAVEKLEERFPKLHDVPRAGIGDAWNDLDMLCALDAGFLLGSLVADQEIPCRLTRISKMGPPGFMSAVEQFLKASGL